MVTGGIWALNNRLLVTQRLFQAPILNFLRALRGRSGVKIHAFEMNAYKVLYRPMRKHKINAHELHPHNMHANEMHANEMHANEMHANERCTPMKHTP